MPQYRSSLPLATILSLLSLAPSGAAQPQFATVISVGDGDTLRAQVNGQPQTLRLACIDAPELTQRPHGTAARQRLQQLLPVGSQVEVEVVERDRYGRGVALVSQGNLSINLALAQEGQAVVYHQFLSSCPSLRDQLLQAEAEARQRRLGFWAQANPVMPWDFRQGARTTPTAPRTVTPTPRVGAPRPPSATPKPTANTQLQTTTLPACIKTDCDCRDFRSQAEAQRVLRAFPGDPFRLDHDGDGVACEGSKR
jgi:micrococcal nuclease